LTSRLADPAKQPRQPHKSGVVLNATNYVM
jgi:hypothetical protein